MKLAHAPRDFFNPWDAAVKQSIAEADKRRWEEINAPKTEVAENAPGPRAASGGNPRGFACPVCWGVPEHLRSDGFTIARHLPASEGAKLYRDTEFCNGQGRPAVAVIGAWSPGSEPSGEKVSARKVLGL